MKFEGEVVDGYSVLLRQYRGDIDTPLVADELVELRIFAKVSEVAFAGHKDGRFFRTHILHVKDVEVVVDGET